MRFLVAILTLVGTAGFAAEESTEAAPAEVTVADETASTEGSVEASVE